MFKRSMSGTPISKPPREEREQDLGFLSHRNQRCPPVLLHLAIEIDPGGEWRRVDVSHIDRCRARQGTTIHRDRVEAMTERNAAALGELVRVDDDRLGALVLQPAGDCRDVCIVGGSHEDDLVWSHCTRTLIESIHLRRTNTPPSGRRVDLRG